MGAYLSAPVTDKDSHAGVGADFVFGGCGMQGWRKSMEDAEILLPELSPDRRDTAMFAVFDGHGGTEVSKFCRKYMPGELQKTRPFQEGQLGKGLVEVFHRMDEMVEFPLPTLAEREKMVVRYFQEYILARAAPGTSIAIPSGSDRAVASDGSDNDSKVRTGVVVVCRCGGQGTSATGC